MRLVALDTETGGFEPDSSALLSLSCVELDAQHQSLPDRILEIFILPCADRTVSPGAAKINGYTPERWAAKGAVSLAEAFRRLAEWIGADAIQVIAHNAKFDQAFIRHYEVKAGIKLAMSPVWSCTLALSRDVCYRKRLTVQNHKLETMARHCGHWAPEYVRGDHGAREDALACAAVYAWAMRQLDPKPAAVAPSAMTFEQASRVIVPFGKYKGSKLDVIATDDRGLSYLDWLRGESVELGLKEALDVYCDDPGIAADLKRLRARSS